MRYKLLLKITIILIIANFSCKSIEQKEFEKDPLYISFYRTARFIMTKYEKNLYKMLPNIKEREIFIKEFWKKRDPTPETDKNEFYDDFQERIDFANKYFRERTKGYGWNTVRGRILLQLGFPFERKREQYNLQSKNAYVPYELWYYPRHEMVIGFVDKNDTGKFELIDPPPGLLTAIRETIESFYISGKNNKKLLKFKCRYEKDYINIKIPVKNILFIEKEKNMIFKSEISVFIYRDSRKFDEINKEVYISKIREKLLKMKYIDINIPYKITEKGKYYFEVILRDLNNNMGYRKFISYRRK